MDEREPLPDAAPNPEPVGTPSDGPGAPVRGAGGQFHGRTKGGNGGGGGSEAQRMARLRAGAEAGKTVHQVRLEEYYARNPRKAPRTADQRASEALARRSDASDTESVVAYGIDRRRLKTKARRLGFRNLQTIKGLRPIHDAAMMVGVKRFLDLIYLAVINRESAAIAWWAIYEGLPAYEQRPGYVNLDEVALMAGVRPDDLLKAIVGSASVYGTRTNELVFAVTHPRVMKAMAQSASRVDAKLPEHVLSIAHRDRVAFLQGGGILKQRGGPSININTKAEAQSAAAAKAEVASADDSVPSFLDDVGSLDRPNADVQRQLQAKEDGEVSE